jgi:hypothetical protein
METRVRSKPVLAGIDQHFLDDRLRLFVFALAELVMANAALGIDEIEGGPIMIIERAPDFVIAVYGDRVVDLEVLQGPFDTVDILLEFEFRRVDTNHHQPVILVFLGPGPDVGLHP